MLGQWRIVLRQAEEAARQGRYAEAYDLASRPEVADHQQAVQFRGKLALDLIARATRRGGVDDLEGAIDDLDLAERIGAPPDSLAAARLNLADRSAQEVRRYLDGGDPERALERIEVLQRRKISGPALRGAREIAEAWRLATSEGRRGEFGRAFEQLERAERLAAGMGSHQAEKAVAAAKVELENRRKSSVNLVETLYLALADESWPRILTAAEAVLGAIPEHPAARQARTNAWRKIAAMSPQGAIPPRATPNLVSAVPPAEFPRVATERRTPSFSPRHFDEPNRRFLLWVDAVGGFLVCLGDRVILGRAGDESQADVPLLGDISRNHAELVRDGDAYLLKPNHATFLNGKQVIGQAIVRHGDVLRLGSTVELEFQRPSPMSTTAKLVVVSRHRLSLAVQSVLLMGETCIIGQNAQSHIVARQISKPVVLYRQAGGLWCRAEGAFEVDGRTRASRAPLTLTSSVLGDGFSFSLETLGEQPV